MVTARYGLAGTKQAAAIDAAIVRLDPVSLVAYFGGGANLYGEINNLAAQMGAGGFRGRQLVVLECRPSWCSGARERYNNRPYPTIRIQTHFVTADATCAGLRSASADLIVALGLLGELIDPLERARQHPNRGRSWDRVFRETLRLLKPGGQAMFGNSSDRQPLDDVSRHAEESGLTVVNVIEEVLTPSDHRYLAILQRQA